MSEEVTTPRLGDAHDDALFHGSPKRELHLVDANYAPELDQADTLQSDEQGTAAPTVAELSLLERLTRVSDGPITPYLGAPSPKTTTEGIRVKSKYNGYATSDPETITMARRLVAQRYLALGFVTAEQINSEGVLDEQSDPYAKHSTYYVLMDRATNQMVATSRRIHYDPAAGEKSFPVWEHKDELDPDYVRQVEATGLDKCVEISSLVRNPLFPPDRTITMELYRQMFHDMWRAGADGEKILLMACKPSLYKNFRILFDGSVERMGPDLDYPGEVAVPALFMSTEGSVGLIEKASQSVLTNRHALIHRGVVRYMLAGANVNHLDPSIIEALHKGPFKQTLNNLKNSPPSEVLDPVSADADAKPTFKDKLKKRKPEIIAGAGLLAYTAARTYGVAEGISPGTDVSWQVFLGIEVATTPPYVMGMGNMVRSTIHPEDYSRTQRLRSTSMAIGSLLAPYAYVVAEGHNMPTGAWAGVGGVAAVSLASVTAKFRSARKAKSKQAESI